MGLLGVNQQSLIERLEACFDQFCEQQEMLMNTFRDEQLRYHQEVYSSLYSITAHDNHYVLGGPSFGLDDKGALTAKKVGAEFGVKDAWEPGFVGEGSGWGPGGGTVTMDVAVDYRPPPPPPHMFHFTESPPLIPSYINTTEFSAPQVFEVIPDRNSVLINEAINITLTTISKGFIGSGGNGSTITSRLTDKRDKAVCVNNPEPVAMFDKTILYKFHENEYGKFSGVSDVGGGYDGLGDEMGLGGSCQIGKDFGVGYMPSGSGGGPGGSCNDHGGGGNEVNFVNVFEKSVVSSLDNENSGVEESVVSKPFVTNPNEKNVLNFDPGGAGLSSLHKPSQVTLRSVLQLCKMKCLLSRGQQVHGYATKIGLDKNDFVVTGFVDMYSKCGRVLEAEYLFGGMSNGRNHVSGTAMITGYSQDGEELRAIKCFRDMRAEGVECNQHTFPSVFTACAAVSAGGFGTQVHSCIVHGGFERNVLVEMFGMPNTSFFKKSDVVSVIVPRTDTRGEQAAESRREGVSGRPSEFREYSSPKDNLERASVSGRSKCEVFGTNGFGGSGSCASPAVQISSVRTSAVESIVKDIRSNVPAKFQMNPASEPPSSYRHESYETQAYRVDRDVCAMESQRAARTPSFATNRGKKDRSPGHEGFASSNLSGAISSANTLPINVEMEPGNEEDDISALTEHHNQFVGSLQSRLAKLEMVHKYWERNDIKGAIGMTQKMSDNAVLADIVSILTEKPDIVTLDICTCVLPLLTSLLESEIDQHRGVSLEMLLKLVKVFGSPEEALKLFCGMRIAGIEPDQVVISSVLSSSAELTTLEFGQQVHANYIKSGFGSSLLVDNSLVTRYAICGNIEDASSIFNLMQIRNVISWTALIVGYAQNGRAKESLLLYDSMTESGIKPDFITFIGLLFACGHAGLAERAHQYFESMTRIYGIKPGPDHYACMIDLLGRSGKMLEAEKLLNEMDVEPDAIVWKALLSACRVHEVVELAERATEALCKLELQNAMPYVMLSNIYSAAGKWEDSARIIRLMKKKGISKKPGCSWIELNSQVHTFTFEDRSNPNIGDIYSKIDKVMILIKEAGYVPDMTYALHDVNEEGKEHGLAFHSERLAVTSGPYYEALLKWKTWPYYEATWEDMTTVAHQFPHFHLEDKVSLLGRGIVMTSQPKEPKDWNQPNDLFKYATYGPEAGPRK